MINKQKYEEAADLRDRERKILSELEKEKENFEKNRNLFKKEVTEDIVYDVVSLMTKIPIHKITTDETEKLVNLKDNLSTKVIGQDEAISIISKSIRRNRVGIKDTNKPIGSFIFLGSTGVGKTYLAKSIAEILFNDPNKVIRVDMSEYMEKHNVAKLIGAPPGYVGYVLPARFNKPSSIPLNTTKLPELAV